MKRQTSTEIEWITYDVHSIAIFTARKRSLGQGNVFTPVCHSAHGGGGGGLCMISLLVRLPCPMFLGGGLCLWSHVPSRGSLSLVRCSFWGGGSLSLFSCSFQGVSVTQTPLDRDPPDSPLLYGNERALRILLECILV